MADGCNTAKGRKVAVLNIDRVPRPEVFARQPSGGNTEPARSPRLRRLLQDLAHSDQHSGSLRSAPQNQLKFLVTCLLKQSQEEHCQHIMLEDQQTEKTHCQQCAYPRLAIPSQQGRLLKARLKPLWPVTINGPSVQSCKGMLPERMRCNPVFGGLTRLQHEIFGKVPVELQQPFNTIHYTSLASLAGTRTK
ncbi:hypothetical protein GDO78_009255 [Eleutherodactylus coqui]|uniref:Uncharacterized protein n=1 Tax=Eleutherodactylus coqui TaxID=57060 RepID=A0A8J6F792_ELECQ|nr:hypothetical protein GDO78_009255 [Eleutherodactylus coqui]